MKKMFISCLITSLLLSVVLPVIQVNAMEQSTNGIKEQNEEQLVPVTLYKDEEQIIIAEVPELYAEEYIQKLEDENFRTQEIANSLGSSVNKADVESRSTSVKYMRKNEVLRVLDSMDKSNKWLGYLSNPLTDLAIGKAAAVLSKNSVVGAVGVVLAWGAANLMGRQEKWWSDSALMILKGEITGVKLSITPSGKDYPKVYRKLTRY